MSIRLIFLVPALLLAAAASPNAGAAFHLEVGHAIAGGFTTSKKAVLVVRPLCCDVSTVHLTATAEGLVDGVRRSIPVRLDALNEPGVHAVVRQWPEGTWVLHLSGTCAERRTTASTLVPLDDNNGFIRDGIRVLTNTATPAIVDAFLRDIRNRAE